MLSLKLATRIDLLSENILYNRTFVKYDSNETFAVSVSAKGSSFEKKNLLSTTNKMRIQMWFCLTQVVFDPSLKH